jgi:hypothetical protein
VHIPVWNSLVDVYTSLWRLVLTSTVLVDKVVTWLARLESLLFMMTITSSWNRCDPIVSDVDSLILKNDCSDLVTC